jgi:hypothetical protein
MHRLRDLGIDIKAARNAALHDLTKEIDPASLADVLGYSAQVMNIHAARAAVPMATYPAIGALRRGRAVNADPKHPAAGTPTPPTQRRM